MYTISPSGACGSRLTPSACSSNIPEQQEVPWQVKVGKLAIPLLLALSSPALAADGAALFARDCASCHGADAKAETPAAKAMGAPSLVGHEASATASHVRQDPKHKAVSGKLSDEELEAIARAIPVH